MRAEGTGPLPTTPTRASRHRLDIYERETAPILDAYGVKGIVDRIDGVGGLDEITERIFAALEARGLVRTAAV